MIYATSGNLVENIFLLSDLLGIIGGIGVIVGGIYCLCRARRNRGSGNGSPSGGTDSAIKGALK